MIVHATEMEKYVQSLGRTVTFRLWNGWFCLAFADGVPNRLWYAPAKAINPMAVHLQ